MAQVQKLNIEKIEISNKTIFGRTQCEKYFFMPNMFNSINEEKFSVQGRYETI